MKRGFGGYNSGCCNHFEVWGISCDAPNPYYLWREAGPMSNSNLEIPYDYQGDLTNDLGTTSQTTIHPELWARNGAGRTWPLIAAKIPSSYPYQGCIKKPVISSNEDGSWSVELTNVTEHHNFTIDTTEYNEIPYFKYCFGTRAIYVDGEQKYIAYRYTSYSRDTQTFTAHYYAPDNRWPGAISIIDINGKSVIGSYDIETSNGYALAFGLTSMEDYFYSTFYADMQDVYNFHGFITTNDGKGICAPNISIGKDYTIFSSYHPDNHNTSWEVARIQYTGSRLGSPDKINIFCSLADVGISGNTYYGDYHILLPSNRVYIMTTGVQPDECWVCAKKIEGPSKLVTGKWLETHYRPGLGSEDEATGYADGTLASSGIKNIILDATNPPSEFTDESWNDLQVRSYNRINGEDLLVFTTEDTPILATPTATFETGNINAGLPSGILSFDNGGSEAFDIWISDTDKVYDGTYSIKTNFQDVTKSAEVTLAITVNPTNSSNLTFWYIHDNRGYGTHQEPWGSIQNSVVEVDHTFAFKVNGVSVPITIDGNPYDNSIIDNINIPNDNPLNDESWYWTWRQVSTTLSPGTNRLTWTTKRVWQDNGHLATWLDDIAFPELLIGDDINGKKRWFFAGGKVRRAKYWSWAEYNNEDEEAIATRVSTVPDFITKDRLGRIYYGNPHYMCRILIDSSGNDALDETFGRPGSHDPTHNGYIRFTASHSTPPVYNPCYDPDTRFTVENIDDPPWGAFQILPTQNNIQIRGANGTMRDATLQPIPTGLYPFKPPVASGANKLSGEYFRNMTVSFGRWSQRPSCWNISQDGKEKIPHLEVIWRPNFELESWPDAPPYSTPPYNTGFANSEPNEWTLQNRPGTYRVRDLFQLSAASTKPRWLHNNWIVPRTYSDAFSRRYQMVWYKRSYDPVNDVGDPFYWSPTWTVDYAAGLGVYGGPWGSAGWSLIQSHFEPCGFKWIAYSTLASVVDLLCPPDDTGTTSAVVLKMNIEADVSLWPMTDFDAVDNSDDCCS